MHSIYTIVIYRNQNQNTAEPRVMYIKVSVLLFVCLKLWQQCAQVLHSLLISAVRAATFLIAHPETSLVSIMRCFF